MKANEASQIVIGAALNVHSALGAGILESACDHLPVVYQGIQLSAAYRVDFIVENCLMVELKCVERLLPVHRAQLLSYLRLSGHKLGLLLNFNVPHMRNGIHRVINGTESEL